MDYCAFKCTEKKNFFSSSRIFNPSWSLEPPNGWTEENTETMQINMRGSGLIKCTDKSFARSSYPTVLLFVSVGHKMTWKHPAYQDCRKFNFHLIRWVLESSIPVTRTSTGGVNCRKNSCNPESGLYLDHKIDKAWAGLCYMFVMCMRTQGDSRNLGGSRRREEKA